MGSLGVTRIFAPELFTIHISLLYIVGITDYARKVFVSYARRQAYKNNQLTMDFVRLFLMWSLGGTAAFAPELINIPITLIYSEVILQIVRQGLRLHALRRLFIPNIEDLLAYRSGYRPHVFPSGAISWMSRTDLYENSQHEIAERLVQEGRITHCELNANVCPISKKVMSLPVRVLRPCDFSFFGALRLADNNPEPVQRFDALSIVEHVLLRGTNPLKDDQRLRLCLNRFGSRRYWPGDVIIDTKLEAEIERFLHEADLRPLTSQQPITDSTTVRSAVVGWGHRAETALQQQMVTGLRRRASSR